MCVCVCVCVCVCMCVCVGVCVCACVNSSLLAIGEHTKEVLGDTGLTSTVADRVPCHLAFPISIFQFSFSIP